MKRILLTLSMFLVAVSVLGQTGGGFNLQQNVIGNGGWRSDGGGFTVLGTMGQSNAGSPTAGSGFHIIDGLWAIENPTPSSPFATVSGKVTLNKGAGIPHVLITIENANTGFFLQTFSQAHGEYAFPGVPLGQNYLISVSHNHFTFETSAVLVFVSQDKPNLNFVSQQ